MDTTLDFFEKLVYLYFQFVPSLGWAFLVFFTIEDEKGYFTMTKRNLKIVQAVLLCLGHNNGGNLKADGDWGNNSTVAGQAYAEDSGIDVPEGKTLPEVLFESFQDKDFQFDLESVNVDKDNLKIQQAYLITQGCDNNGELNADGEEGPNTEAAALQYATKENLSVVGIVADDMAEKSQSGMFTLVFQPAETAGETIAA